MFGNNQKLAVLPTPGGRHTWIVKKFGSHTLLVRKPNGSVNKKIERHPDFNRYRFSGYAEFLKKFSL